MEAFRKTMWARQIVANTEPAKSIALYVRECYFQFWGTSKDSVREFLFPFSTLYGQAMGCMTNIRKVAFLSSFVSKEHWKAMAALKQLDLLVFGNCTFIDDPPDQELYVRSVKLFESSTSFILRPIATSTLRILDTEELGPVLKLVTARQLAIEKFIFRQDMRPVRDMDLLPQVLERLPGLETLILIVGEREASPLIRGLAMKKMFTHLRSFTVTCYGHYQDPEKLISDICDGPGTLPRLEELDLLFPTSKFGKPPPSRTTFDIVSDLLEGTIMPAFPNVKCIHTPEGGMRWEKGGWKYQEIRNRVGPRGLYE